MDFGALPPEINSIRIYSGPGSAPLVAAAAAWDGLASELNFTAASYGSAISDLVSSGWQGPSSVSMASAAAPYTAWLSGTAAYAEQAALQAKTAAGAFEAVFAGVVPPPVIATNRAFTAALIATNIFGQNSSAIAAAEAEYAEFWAQDATAMYAYAGASTAASQLTPFTVPPDTTSGSNSAASEAATQTDVLTQISQFLTSLQQQLTASISQFNTAVTGAMNNFVAQVPNVIPTSAWTGATFPADINNVLKSISNLNTAFAAGPYTPTGIAYLIKNWYQVSISIPSLGTGIQGIGPLMHPKGLTGVLAPLLHSDILSGAAPAAHAASAVTAGTGRASTIGALSVPNSWASAVPAVRMAAISMPETAVEAAPAIAATGRAGMFAETALASLAGRALGDTATRTVSRSVPRAYTRNVPRFTNGVVAEDDSIATTATIIVIPPSSE